MNIRIVIADDHAVVRDGLDSLLKNEKDIELIGKAENGLAVVKLAEKHTPDVIVMDISMSDMDGIEATKKILKKIPDIKIIVLSMHNDKRYIAEAFKAGALGYLLKDDAYNELAQGIRTVVSGKRYFSVNLSKEMVEGYIKGASNGEKAAENILTYRELQTLKLLAEGYNSKQIGGALNISTRTVDIHRKHLMDKLEIFSIAELTKYAIYEGLTSLKKEDV